MRELRADQTAAKEARRAARERELAEKIRRANEGRGLAEPVPVAGGGHIVGSLNGLPIVRWPARDDDR
jgi:hypothetical protein